MPVTAQEIARLLPTLDVTNDAQWTDDGSPRVDVVQKLLNDASITRRQINEALPGFNRTPPGAEQAASGETQPMASKTDAEVSNAVDAADDAEIDDPTSDKVLTREEVRAIMQRRLDDASVEVGEAQAAIRRANEALVAAQRRETRLRLDLNRRFPPLSQEENIQAHLRAGHARMEAEIAAQQSDGRSQIDTAMSQTNRRGWTRPSRPVNNAA